MRLYGNTTLQCFCQHQPPAANDECHEQLCGSRRWRVGHHIVCAIVDVPYAATDIVRKWARIAEDKREHKQVAFVEDKFDSIIESLVTGNVTLTCNSAVEGTEVNEDRWHPTSKYRLYRYCCSEYGHFETDKALGKGDATIVRSARLPKIQS